jgi:predicted Zn-dependent protease
MKACAGALVAACLCVAAVRTPQLFRPGHGFARWIENVPAGSDVEKAMFRAMQLPGGEILFRRPPGETVPALTALEQTQKDAALYSLRAMEEEQGLDFAAAEKDWKTWAEQAEDRPGANLDLADFYERRLKPQDELAALAVVGESPAVARERWTAVESQRSWLAFDRALKVVDEYALPRSESERIYAAWMKRYQNEPSVYAREFVLLLDGREFGAASDLLARYRQAFPDDHIFPVKADAELAVQHGSAKDGLAVYDARFEPLWPAELVKDYFDLVLRSHNQRAFGDALRAKLAANPDDLKDAARLFYLYQQQGQLDSAKALLTHYREQKEQRGAKWSAEELDTLEQLFEAVQDFPEAARYAYALAADHSATSSERKGSIALTRILLTAPEQPLRVGAGNLALYKDIATMDRGPGYLNGILSLFLNTQGPADEYANEDQLAIPYFHRARAAELLKEIDQRFADDAARPMLHTKLMEAYAAYGEDAAVIREGTGILAQFPQYDGRVTVALELADAYERTRQADKEFALYQDLLKELAAQADGVPLGAESALYSKSVSGQHAPAVLPAKAAPKADDGKDSSDAESSDANADSSGTSTTPAPSASNVRSAQYAQVLDRYLARLVALHRLPDALTVLRGELDRNAKDPGLYQKLADFLEQNSLNSHEEEVYQRAIQQFQDTGWYAKLARFYLRQKRSADYSALMRKVTDVFSGTEVEEYLQQAPAPDRSLALEVNLYAYQHFPHELVFVDRLTANYAFQQRYGEEEKLLWAHWWESAELRDRLFELLSKNGQLGAQLATLRQQNPEIEKADWNGMATRDPAAERFWLEACVWQSHDEDGMGAADALATAYPADGTIGEKASSLHRSLAYFHAADTDKAVATEKRMADAQPGNLDVLARIGDIYADRGRMAEAGPYWVRMADVHPGESDGYLQSATVFWDYFDFGSAQAQLEKGQRVLNEPTLFGYQAGAIDESRGDVSAAIHEYVTSASADTPSAESRDRLLALARRPAAQALVEQGTAELLKQAAPSVAAIQLRAGILEAEHRTDDLVRELNATIAQTGSFDVLDAISAAARNHSLPGVEEAALRRQVALTTDPVRNLQLRYQLVDLLQSRTPSAAVQEVDAIYREHGKILGVVRSTVDYDWDHERKQQAVAVLLESAQLSYPELKTRFELEAARKLTDMGDMARSRALLTTLLSEKPLDSACEAAMAENLARANDHAGLATFYGAQLELVRKSNLDHDEKEQRIGQLRRGVIGAATQLKNYNEAVDQYIELINSYPDDGALAQEAALYATAHDERDHLFAFYQKTVNNSPRDPRWSIVLARLATAAEDDALAIDAYGKALKLRPERQDLYIAQGGLEEKLHRFDDAIGLYRKLYTLSYRDPKWMEKVAELCARQGKNADAVKALESAWIEGRPEKAANSFAVAQRLEQWGLLEDAQRYAEKGVQQAGADLLVSEQSGAALYARILTRQRQSEAAYTRLAQARDDAPKLTLAAVAQQAIKSGPGEVTDEEWRKQREEERRTQATTGFAGAVQAMGKAIGEFYTPEEKLAFTGWMKANTSAATVDDLRAVYLPTMKSAGLVDVTSDLMWDIARRSGNLDADGLSEWMQLQKSRLQVEAEAARLEKLAPSAAAKKRARVWESTAAAYRDAGDEAAELRATERRAQMGKLDGDARLRYYKLLLAQKPQELIRIASGDDSAAQYLVENGAPDQALEGVAARAQRRKPIWKAAYTGLTGLYLREYRPELNTAFVSALNADATIGNRVDHPADRDQQLAGEVWFYYGSRYGEYLDDEKDPRAQDYLEAELEHTPGASGAYLVLANYSVDAGHADAALADYQHSLDLNGDQPAVLDSIATIAWKQGRQGDALTAWQTAVKRLAAEMDARHVPETFWSDFQRVLGNMSAHGQYEQVRQPVDAMLRIYIARNGSYRVEPLLEAGYHANGDSVDWLLTITAAASGPAEVLNSIVPNQWSSQGEWIKKQDVSRILAHIVELRQRVASDHAESDDGVNDARLRYVEALVDEKKFAEARTVLAQVPNAKRNAGQWLPSVLAVAQSDETLDTLIAQWQRRPDSAPADNDLRSALGNLPAKVRRSVMRFVYQRALDLRELTAPNFLGLAAIELDEKDVQAAVGLLKRMTLLSDTPYADTDSAAQLLEGRQHFKEAIEFLRPLEEASPWDAGFKLRLAKAMLTVDPRSADAVSMLAKVKGDPKAGYQVRVAAAIALKGHDAAVGGSDELKLLAQAGCPSVESVSKPYFVEARLAAAACAKNNSTKASLLADALASEPSNTRVRLTYIWPAFASDADARALVATDPFLQNASVYAGGGRAYQEDDNGESAIAPASDGGDQAEGAPSLLALKRADRIRLLELALAIYEKRRDFANASKMVELALAQFPPDDKQRTALEEKRKQIETELARAQENEARAPNIRADLDQDRIVRPRLLPGMPVPAQPAKEDKE